MANSNEYRKIGLLWNHLVELHNQYKLSQEAVDRMHTLNNLIPIVRFCSSEESNSYVQMAVDCTKFIHQELELDYPDPISVLIQH